MTKSSYFLLLLLVTSCASPSRIESGAAVSSWTPPVQNVEHTPDLDGSLAGYVDLALQHHPRLRESHARWDAARYRSASAFDWPDPTLTYEYFIQPVETRVGPQQHRLGLMQPIPWPGKVSAASDAAQAGVAIEEHKFAAQMLEVRRRVAELYWQIWSIDQLLAVEDEQVTIIEGLAQSLRGRAEIGQASVADMAQVELMLSKMRDQKAALTEKRHRLSARFTQALGTATDRVKISSQPPVPRAHSDADIARLASLAASHPSIEVVGAMQNQTHLVAERAQTNRLPDFAIGVDYIITGEAAMPDVADSGKDPIVAMLSIKLPVFSTAENATVDEANATNVSLSARKQAITQQLVASIHATASQIRDAARRSALYHDTLIPQAEAAYASVRAAYEVGKGGIASLLLAQRDLIELQRGLVTARADFAIASSQMQALVPYEVE